LPVVHCVKGTQGWQIAEDMLDAARGYSYKVIDKPTFGSVELAQYLAGHAPWDEIEIVGLVSSICVASNALIIKAYLPETRIAVDASCTAGVTEDDGKAALTVMKMCHIDVRNEAAP
ncbi:MAG: isochorismatase family protein, partial [Azoarcus sp.]|jgi:nicotinamidase-related amidase|nr:isochorismatase family protein [Azoarcus sp.]